MTPSQASPKGSRPIRVLLLTDEMEVGGTQRQIAYLARSLDRNRFESTVAFFRNRSFIADDLERDGVHVVELPKRGRIDLVFVHRLVAYLRDGRFDVMHCFAFSGELWGTVARLLLQPSRRPVLITSVRNKYDWYTGLQWRIKRWASLQSSRIIANSRAGGEYAREKMSLPPGSISVVYNGVADVSDAAAALPDSRHGEPIAALFVGRLVEQKNMPVLLRAMKRLQGDGIDVRLRVAGDGPLRDAYLAQVEEQGLVNSIEFLGERSDTRALMASSDFVVLPSIREGLSNVILEAMVTGRPVVASAVGGNVELVENGVTGLLFSSDDDIALASAIGTLVADAGLRERLGAAGRQRAIEQFTVSAMVGAMETIYSECVRDRPPARAMKGA